MRRRYLLTEREAQILDALTCRASYANISSKLGITVSTLRTHIRSGAKKIGFGNRVELILILIHDYGWQTGGNPTSSIRGPQRLR